VVIRSEGRLQKIGVGELQGPTKQTHLMHAMAVCGLACAGWTGDQLSISRHADVSGVNGTILMGWMDGWMDGWMSLDVVGCRWMSPSIRIDPRCVVFSAWREWHTGP
jgi:hypothetical protein